MTEQGRYFYVDSINGDDSCSGFTPEEAWRSLEKVNELIFQPGDHIRFRRGGEWHGMLKYMVTDVMRQFCWKASAIGG